MTRTLTIRTDPPGAQVFVDDELIGESPVEMEFVHYGVRKIVIEKRDYDGKLVYERETVYARISPPYYQVFPIDFFTDVVVPIDIKDERVLRFKLRQKKFRPLGEKRDELLKEAEELRDKAFATEVR
ncbi:MAG: PEGA domain-containing protein [Candidatus Brocadiales bacterium]